MVTLFWTWQDLCIQGDTEPVNILAQKERIPEPRPLTEKLWRADGFWQRYSEFFVLHHALVAVPWPRSLSKQKLHLTGYLKSKRK